MLEPSRFEFKRDIPKSQVVLGFPEFLMVSIWMLKLQLNLELGHLLLNPATETSLS